LNCRICGKPIVLVPSARKRAARYGGRPQNYTVLFREHTECALLKRERETAELMRKINQEYVNIRNARCSSESARPPN